MIFNVFTKNTMRSLDLNHRDAINLRVGWGLLSFIGIFSVQIRHFSFDCGDLNPRLTKKREKAEYMKKHGIAFKHKIVLKADKKFSSQAYHNPQPNTNPKNPWTSHVIDHFLSDSFRDQLECILKNLNSNFLFACYVTIFDSRGSNYLSLGPQFLTSNNPNMDEIMKYLNKHYDLLATRYYTDNTDKAIVKIRLLNQKTPEGFKHFFFEEQETFRKPHRLSGPIVNALYFPYVNLNKKLESEEHTVIIHETDSNIVFFWKKFPEWFIVEYDKVNRKGISYNKNHNIQFEDTFINDYIVRYALGYQITFDPVTQTVITYAYKANKDMIPIKPLPTDNPMANDISKEAFIKYLKDVKGLNKDEIMNLNLNDFVKPITPKHNIGVIDCETIHDISFDGNNRKLQKLDLVSIGAFTVDNQNRDCYNEEIITNPLERKEAVRRSVQFLIDKGVKFIYVHNWAGFDSILLFQFIEPFWNATPLIFDNKMISVKLFPKDKKVTKNSKPLVTISDSLKLLPLGQAKLAESFNVPTLKGHFPHYFDPREHTKDGSIFYNGPFPDYKYFEPKRTSLENYKKMAKNYTDNWNYAFNLLKYQKDDCKGLHQIICKFQLQTYNQFGLDCCNSISIPGLAFKLWRCYNLPHIYNTPDAVMDLPRNINTMLREAYFGGHVDVYIPKIEGNQWNAYDVNSLYPSSMLKDLPCGKPTHVTNPQLDNFFGFVYATVEVPAGVSYPTLPYRTKGKVIFPTGTFTGLWFSEEVKFAVSNGAVVKSCHWGLSFNRRSDLFKDLIEKLNSIKVVSSKPETYNESLRTISKLLMNSLYGRLGLRYLDEVSRIYDIEEQSRIHLLFKVNRVIPFEDGRELIIHSRLPSVEAIRIIDPNSREVDLLSKEIDLSQNTNVALAAAITAYSRIKINMYKYHVHSLGGRVAYSDTDSLVCDVDLSEDMISGTQLGLMKLERKPTKGYFVAPKLYYQEYLGKTGVIETYVKSRGYGGSLTEQNFIDLYNDKTITLSKDKWYRYLSGHRVEIKNVSLTFTSEMTKREKIYESNVWTSTKPIHLDESVPLREITPTTTTQRSDEDHLNKIKDTLTFVTDHYKTEMSERHKDYQKEIEKLHKEKENLKNSLKVLMNSKILETTTTNEAKITQLEQENNQLREEIRQQGEEIRQQREEIISQKELIRDLNTLITDQNVTIKQQSVQLKNQSTQISSLMSQNDAIQKEFKTQSAHIEKLTSHLSQILEAIKRGDKDH